MAEIKSAEVARKSMKRKASDPQDDRTIKKGRSSRNPLLDTAQAVSTHHILPFLTFEEQVELYQVNKSMQQLVSNSLRTLSSYKPKSLNELLVFF